ncbi:MAG TPA: alpha/beta hydrolase [Pseudonocardiaceae bacterium]|nr:alpha/beta hydrolase [Pseudonocardiaceae bacterium]
MSVQQPSAGPTRTVGYGPDPAQIGDLYLPAGPGPFPVVVLIHGGYWTALYDRRETAALAEDLRARGYAVWNIEYRTLGEPGAGWPGTFQDVADAVDAIQDVERSLDLSRVITVGHSAGGHLAIWAASRSGLPAQAPGFAPKVHPIAAVSIAGVLDLVAADADRAGAGVGSDGPGFVGESPIGNPEYVPAVVQLVRKGVLPALLGGHAAEYPERYAWTSPIMLGSGNVPILAVHGIDDDVVPIRYGRNYLGAAVARHESIEFRELPGIHHFELLDPAHPKWLEITDWLAKQFAEPRSR